MSVSLFPLVAFDLIDNDRADQLLVDWGHWLGGCNRPFGRQSFGLHVEGLGLVSVAVSASTVGKSCADYDRQEVVELARLCSHPDHRWASRVCLRLWREISAQIWEAKYWPVKALVSYSNNARHKGNLYRFDGWTRWGTARAGTATNYGREVVKIEEKTIWTYPVSPVEVEAAV